MSDTGGQADGESAANTDRDPADIVDGIDRPVLLFDGVCNLCNGSVRAIVRFDSEGEILFAPLQSDVATELLSRVGLETDYLDSVVLIENTGPPPEEHSTGDDNGRRAYTKSTAILRICRKLDGPLPLLYPLIHVPERIRNGVYDLVADHRYQVFGKKDACPVPDEHIRRRFLERSLA